MRPRPSAVVTTTTLARATEVALSCAPQRHRRYCRWSNMASGVSSRISAPWARTFTIAPLNFSSRSATETLSCTYHYFAFIVLCKLCLPVSHLPIFDLLTILHFARQMLPLIYLRKLISQLPYLLLDGYMKLSNHLTFRAHRISNVLLTSFCYYRCTFCNVFTK